MKILADKEVDHEAQRLERIEALSRMYLEIKAQIEALNDSLQATNSELASLLHEGTHDCGAYRVQVRTSARLSTSKLAKRFPAYAYPEIYKSTPDIKLARAHLHPHEISECVTESAQAVIVKPLA